MKKYIISGTLISGVSIPGDIMDGAYTRFCQYCDARDMFVRDCSGGIYFYPCHRLALRVIWQAARREARKKQRNITRRQVREDYKKRGFVTSHWRGNFE